jgi:hypothetical protein
MMSWMDDAGSLWRLQRMVGDDRLDAELCRLIAQERDACHAKSVDTLDDDRR